MTKIGTKPKLATNHRTLESFIDYGTPNCLPNFMKIESPLNFGTLYSIRDFEKLESLIIFQELENNHHFDRFSTSKLEFSFNPKLGSFSSITNCHLVIQLSTPMCLFVEVTFDESSQ